MMGDVSAQAGDAPSATPGAPPAPPSTPGEARLARDSLMADKGFATAYFNGDTAARTKWNELGALINGADRSDAVARAMSGEEPQGTIQNSDDVELRGQAGYLKDLGLNEVQVKETLEGKKPTAAEVELARQWKKESFKSKEFVARLFSGEPAERQQLLVANIILSAAEG